MGRFDRADRQAYTTPRDPAPPGGRPPRPLTPAEVQEVWQAEVLAQLRLLATKNSDAAGAGAGQILNGVLEVSTYVLDATGQITKDYHAMVGSIIVVNNAATPLTVLAGTSPSDSPPTTGKGVQIVLASTWLAIPIGARSFTVYGTPGAQLALQVFTGMQALGVA